jgi:hypothetical protein
MSTLNQFWTENQLLFATLCSVAATFFFKDQLWQTLHRFKASQKYFFANFSRGLLFGLILILGLIFNRRYEFLGFAVQLNLNFLTSYAWIFRAFLILALVASNEFLVRVVTESTFDREAPPALTFSIRLLTELAVYWIWFNPSPSECFTLLLLFSLFSHFWSATGFLSGLFIMTHAVFSLPFFENEFLGLFQLKLLKNDDRFYQNPYLQLTLVILLVAFKLIPQYYLAKASPKRKDALHP